MSLVWFCSSLYGKALHLKELNLVPSASFCYKRKGKIALRTKLLKKNDISSFASDEYLVFLIASHLITSLPLANIRLY